MPKKDLPVSEEAIMNERLSAIEWQFQSWLKRVRLNSEERDEIESMIDELKTLAVYK